MSTVQCFHEDLGEDQFIVGCIVDNINNLCFAHTALRATGEVAHTQPQGMKLLVAHLHMDCGYVGGANLNVGSKAAQLIFFFCGGAFSCPHLVVLVPYLQRCP